jgi:hypothetical protein
MNKHVLFLQQKMNIRKLSYFSVCFVLLLGYACSPAYIPNTVNSPLFSNKGEFNAAISAGTSNFDPQLSYALTNHMGIVLNGSFANRKSDSTDDFHKHTIVELGAGYYTKLDETFRFEAFGGYGMGKVDGKFTFIVANNVQNARFNKIYIQPAIGATSDFFDFSIATRFSFINMNLTDPDYNGKNKFSLFVEPVLTGKLGYKNVKLIGQMGFSFSTKKEMELQYEYQPFMISIGLQLNFGKKEVEKE